VNTVSSTQRQFHFLPELSIETFPILEVSFLHGLPSSILARADWSAAPPLHYLLPFCNLSSSAAAAAAAAGLAVPS
jgi:hypothetical protein